MDVTEAMIQELAKKAKLNFSGDEKGEFAKQLNNVIAMVDELDGIQNNEVEDIPGIYHGIHLENVYREDVAEKGTKREALLNNAPSKKDGLIQVPAMLAEDGEGNA